MTQAVKTVQNFTVSLKGTFFGTNGVALKAK